MIVIEYDPKKKDYTEEELNMLAHKACKVLLGVSGTALMRRPGFTGQVSPVDLAHLCMHAIETHIVDLMEYSADRRAKQ